MAGTDNAKERRAQRESLGVLRCSALLTIRRLLKFIEAIGCGLTAQGRQPSVFHFLGHGDDGGLYFENEHGEARLAKGHELKDVLAHSPVKIVLRNACGSAMKRGASRCDFPTREQVADLAIGHEAPIADESAIEFARQFYSPITQGKTIREACLRARNSFAEH